MVSIQIASVNSNFENKFSPILMKSNGVARKGSLNCDPFKNFLDQPNYLEEDQINFQENRTFEGFEGVCFLIR